MRALITGISGFVGPYLTKALLSAGYDVYGLDRNKCECNDCSCVSCDITDSVAVQRAIADAKPDFIFHLAGQSSVRRSFDEPELTYKINVEGTNNILAALVNLNIKPKVLVVSSADVYGEPESLPIDEDAELSPKSPYAESRVEQEEIALRYKEEYGIPVIISRSFSHTGPGQPANFVCPNFSKQVALVKKGKQSVIKVGNIDVKRDFTDVRDMVKAYRILAEKGAAGEIYNAGSGKSYSLRQVLDILLKEANTEAKIEQDPSRIRKKDPQEILGDNSKLSALGWRPEIPFEKTLKDLLAYWMERA
ncbi:GDP-mannose 4,6-dehydratase [Candidatus Woesearchaeota archaeon]|nr:GDP-mannose 4,6-dehydratase [Candidatus Woesearchaeota archaeon]